MFIRRLTMVQGCIMLVEEYKLGMSKNSFNAIT